ncbi:MAG: hypothetical protein ACP5KY_01645 [Thermoproteus sp.]
MRLPALLPLLAALVLASPSTFQILVGPNATIPVSINGSALVVNGTRYNVPQLPYTWIAFPPSAKSYLAVVGLSYPFSACQFASTPDGFSVSCEQNQPMTVVYVASPGYSLYCDQQPLSRQLEGQVGVLQFNSLRLDCRLIRGAVGATLNPSLGLLTAVLGAVASALGIAFAGLLLAMVLKQRGGEASSR